RLLFAAMSRTAPHIMLLDEPTNHLDVDSREALIAALNTYEGAVVLVSHDPHLVELVCDTLWVVQDGTCQPFEGDLKEYRQSLQDAQRKRRAPVNGETGGTAQPRLDKKAERRARADARAALQPLRDISKKAEKTVARLTQEKLQLEQKLADPKVYNGDSAEVMRLQKQLGKIAKDLSQAETAWLEAQAALESVTPE
ncbi:MAG TPA: ABC transporter ATP-binding protein, partial [Magnetovibrio sp.]